MKKIFGLLALTFIVTSCDDGDLTVANIDFSDVTTGNCGNIIYKLKESEASFFEVQNPDALFANDVTLPGEPRVVLVNEANRIFYRAYSGPITSENICGTIPPATPSVMEEWTFTGGRIEVTTTAVIVDNPEFAGGEKIQQYRHQIVFADVTKNTPGGSEILTIDYGFYTTTPTSLPFNFGDSLQKCGNIITSVNGSEALTLDIDPSLIESAVTPPGTPRIGVLGTTINKLTYSLFQSAVTDSYFCAATTPTTPILQEQWTGESGIPGVSGIVEVTTTSSGPGVYSHEIHLKDVKLRKGNSAFILADDYMLGMLTTN